MSDQSLNWESNLMLYLLKRPFWYRTWIIGGIISTITSYKTCFQITAELKKKICYYLMVQLINHQKQVLMLLVTAFFLLTSPVLFNKFNEIINLNGNNWAAIKTKILIMQEDWILRKWAFMLWLLMLLLM